MYAFLRIIKDFNPLPRKEGDLETGAFLYPKIISIHSLVKRETMTFREKVYDLSHFNPLPRKEGDGFK